MMLILQGRDSALQGTTRQGTTLQRCTLFVGRKRTSRSCVKVFAGKKGIGTYYYGYNNDALSQLQPECSWYMTWSSNSNNVAGTSTVRTEGTIFARMLLQACTLASGSNSREKIGLKAIEGPKLHAEIVWWAAM